MSYNFERLYTFVVVVRPLVIECFFSPFHTVASAVDLCKLPTAGAASDFAAAAAATSALLATALVVVAVAVVVVVAPSVVVAIDVGLSWQRAGLACFFA